MTLLIGNDETCEGIMNQIESMSLGAASKWAASKWGLLQSGLLQVMWGVEGKFEKKLVFSSFF